MSLTAFKIPKGTSNALRRVIDDLPIPQWEVQSVNMNTSLSPELVKRTLENLFVPLPSTLSDLNRWLENGGYGEMIGGSDRRVSNNQERKPFPVLRLSLDVKSDVAMRVVKTSDCLFADGHLKQPLENPYSLDLEILSMGFGQSIQVSAESVFGPPRFGITIATKSHTRPIVSKAPSAASSAAKAPQPTHVELVIESYPGGTSEKDILLMAMRILILKLYSVQEQLEQMLRLNANIEGIETGGAFVVNDTDKHTIPLLLIEYMQRDPTVAYCGTDLMTLNGPPCYKLMYRMSDPKYSIYGALTTAIQAIVSDMRAIQAMNRLSEGSTEGEDIAAPFMGDLRVAVKSGSGR